LKLASREPESLWHFILPGPPYSFQISDYARQGSKQVYEPDITAEILSGEHQCFVNHKLRTCHSEMHSCVWKTSCQMIFP